jgi:hypothetical protein
VTERTRAKDGTMERPAICQPISGCANQGTCAASGRSGQELGQFLTKAVTSGIRKSYAADWRSWESFLAKSTTILFRGDVYLDLARDDTERTPRSRSRHPHRKGERSVRRN